MMLDYLHAMLFINLDHICTRHTVKFSDVTMQDFKVKILGNWCLLWLFRTATLRFT